MVKDKIEEFLAQYRPNTQSAYRGDLERLFVKQLSNDLSKDDVTFCANELINRIDPRSAARIFSCWKSFFRFLGRKDLLDPNNFPLVKYSRKQPIFGEQATILNFLDQISAKSPKEIRDYTVCYLLAATGLRISELLGIRLDQVKNDQWVVDGKSGRSRYVYIGDKTRLVIENYLIHSRPALQRQTSPPYLLLSNKGLKLNDRSVRKIITRLVSSDKLPKGFHPHAFRHSFASMVLENGMNLRFIQELLGHESVETTSQYLHLSKKKLAQELKRVHPLNQKIE
jgi:site-specific recombinase XerD